MEKKGLCCTCTELKACIFSKEPPVWQCEEFSDANHAPTMHRQVKAKRVIREEATEAE